MQSRLSPDRIIFARGPDGAPCGTASAWRMSGREEIGGVHMVAVAPAHKGKGLGRAVTLAVLHKFRDEGLSAAELLTDDHRRDLGRGHGGRRLRQTRRTHRTAASWPSPVARVAPALGCRQQTRFPSTHGPLQSRRRRTASPRWACRWIRP